ncbi:LysR substrate-binding domain-containing protein [Craterilacuibacter sp. RT1T]|uniref:LysR substrate-binding domain-containing protein n=1 Tax=Craterilacuibacter sp. RT1T TaxID=2942211 RepID=UPI0020BE3331|nr:LysR substrate-binding domain-containing protein [Craterilacuibacter sp. RT1T]MCL6264340.1 LysR substrate-binding domain-containing protein [Craterilacuibacter sp. RT1T]
MSNITPCSDMQTQQIRAFYAIMTHGTITTAAQSLGITQPAATRLLKSMEQDLGFLLFERTRQQLLPTAEARALIKDAERVFQALDRIEHTAERLRELPQGDLYIAALPLLSVAFIPQVLATFAEEQHTRFVLRNYRSEQINLPGAQKAYDIGFCICDQPVAGADVLSFRSEYLCLLPKNSPLANVPSLSPLHLAGQQMVCYEHDFPQKQIDAEFARHGLHYNKVAEASFAYSIGAMVEAGLGYAILDPFTSILYAERGLHFKPFKPAIPFEFNILIPCNRPLSRAGERFLRTFLDKVDDEGIVFQLQGQSPKAIAYLERLGRA